MLTREELASDLSDEEIFKAIANEAHTQLPTTLQENLEGYYAALPKLPPGVRAYAGIWDLDVSMAMDDIAWHFGNHDEERHTEETLWSLRELHATEAHDIFAQAVSIVHPHLEILRSGTIGIESFHDWLDETGIQSACDPLNKRLWQICAENPDHGLLYFAIKHARNAPDRFIFGHHWEIGKPLPKSS
jgi:hypothetical protein